jgi:hypothetical protein
MGIAKFTTMYQLFGTNIKTEMKQAEIATNFIGRRI